MGFINNIRDALVKSLQGDIDSLLGDETLQKLGVPYPEGFDLEANKNLEVQAAEIVKSLKDAGVEVMPNTEIVALISYLQRLGTDIKATAAN